MAHLSSTMDRIKDAEGDRAPLIKLPGIGLGVRFTLRGQEFRGGANCFAAIVTRAHPEKGVVDLLVLMDADDYMSQRDVPEMTAENGWGWQPVDGGAMAALEAFKEELAQVIFGGFEKSEESVYDTLTDLDTRLKALESARKRAPKTASRKPRRRAKG